MDWRTLLGAIVACALFALAIRTSTLAVRSGRSEIVWLLYGLFLPVISFVHILAVTHETTSR
jgi:hypothetical protein